MSYPDNFALSSEAFAEGGQIPRTYTCDGSEISPQLAWQNAPAGARSFALIVRDPDAPSGDFIHWVLYNVPADTSSLPSSPAGNVGVGQQGRNSGGKASYTAPCPPRGLHHYHFTLYALDTLLTFDKPPSASELTDAMQGHMLGQAELMGTYQR
jgi:Raf kinase inhibitor-like YbhB/YbcL family protein